MHPTVAWTSKSIPQGGIEEHKHPARKTKWVNNASHTEREQEWL